ncbi:MAG: GyrI-like domain-containing protein [Deltaproteobacteria bacterium]|nr:GyrI-like domain-containing protein [Deltaproteobacteria bacterium]
MIDTPSLTDSPERTVAVLRITVPRNGIREVMGPAFAELLAVVKAQGVGPAGALFSHHHRMDPEVFDFEVGVPVTAAVTPSGRVEPGLLPAARVARTVYHGGYEGLGDAWGAFLTWVNTQPVAQRADFWETYLSGPESGLDPSRWQTELVKPLSA